MWTLLFLFLTLDSTGMPILKAEPVDTYVTEGICEQNLKVAKRWLQEEHPGDGRYKAVCMKQQDKTA